jgi:predicted AAA+ superfamily ATPase
MNEKEKEVSLEDPRVCLNSLARQRHIARSEDQCAMDASRWATQRGARSNAQITTDASQRAAQRAACSDAQIAFEINTV